MSESAQHLHLVNLIIDEVVNLVGETNRCFIMSDAADGYALSPLTEEGYRPDVYYQYQNCLIMLPFSWKCCVFSCSSVDGARYDLQSPQKTSEKISRRI